MKNWYIKSHHNIGEQKKNQRFLYMKKTKNQEFASEESFYLIRRYL